MTRAAWLIAIASACKGSAPSPAPQPTATAASISVRLDGRATNSLSIPADLWSLCTTYPHVTIVAKSATGTYAQGSCDQRGDYAFAVTADASARLDATFDGARSTIARADHVVAIELAQPSTTPPPPPDSLTIAVAGKPPTVISADELDALGPTQHHREGVPLAALLAAAHVAVSPATRVVATTADDRYEIAGAWLRDPSHALVFRHNQHGMIRFDHTGPGGREKHLRGVKTLEVL